MSCPRTILRNHGPLNQIASAVVQQFHAAPGATVAIAKRHEKRWLCATGAFGNLFDGGPTVTDETIYDLASVTKPYTALLAARAHRLAKQGEAMGPRFDDPLGLWVAEARETPSEQVTLELLMAHRSGLDGHRPLYAPLLRGDSVKREHALRVAASARRPECVGNAPLEGFAPVYSDLGYLLLGEALMRAADTSLEELVASEITAFTNSRVCSAAELDLTAQQIAPTEIVDFRGGSVYACVHDENAWAIASKGICGHAGLFGDALNVLNLGISLIEVMSSEVADWLSPQDIEPLLRKRPGGTLLAGFDAKSEVGSSAGTLFSANSFGHLGFTGTSLWVDPTAEMVGILLSNRVHPTRENQAIKLARPATYDALAQWAFQQMN